MKKTSLRRGVPLKRGKPLVRRTRIKPVSAKRRRRDAGYEAARQAVLERSRGMCEARFHADDCSQRVEQVHHIGGRGGLNPHRLDNLLGVSEACHRDIHAFPARAYRLGLMTPRNRGGCA